MKFFDRVIRKTEDIPAVPLRDLVVFPGMVVPVFGGRRPTVDAIDNSMEGDRRIFLVCQKTPTQDPREEDLYPVGCIGHILQVMKLPDGTVRILVEGQQRASVVSFTSKEPYFRAQVQAIPDASEANTLMVSLMRTTQEAFKIYASFNKKIPPEMLASIERADKPDRLADLVCAHGSFKTEIKAKLLGITNPETRLRELVSLLQSENEILELQQKINTRVKKRIEKGQREYFLQEQMKEINRELGKEPDDPSGVKELEEKIKAKGLPEEVHAKALKELKRLERLQTFSPEAGILRTYVEWITDLPWNEKTEDSQDIERAARILDEDHYDLKDPKERILDFIAVHQLKEKVKGPILCFVGPPGTGKTSLGKSVARCLGRKFVRISLGGVRDEAEIRGHRKTYVGALPGKIIQSMRKAGSKNPVFLLDEVDKMSSDFRGDPSAALLEVLDPEQNGAFVDHYLEVAYDLSDVMFITTANSLHNIPYPLRDRMEVIEIPGYTEYEKLVIAEKFIVPKQIDENGLSWARIHFRKDGLREIIRKYTMESGVRNLEREIAHVIRKIAREAVSRGYIGVRKDPSPEPSLTTVPETAAADKAATPAATDKPSMDPSPPVDAPSVDTVENVATGKRESAEDSREPSGTEAEGRRRRDFFSIKITAKSIPHYLGNPKYKRDILYKESRAGLAYGLAWTELGGTILPVEAAFFEGRGELVLTGSLGDVMKESALTSFSFIKSSAHKFKLSSDFYKNKDLHIHVPEGAIPKDGPSAGITITAALLSCLSGVCIHPGFAMTGEITLTGKILPIGGVKEKILAAHRTNMLHVLIPRDNEKDIEELPKEVVSSIEFIFVDTIVEALGALFPPEIFQIRAF